MSRQSLTVEIRCAAAALCLALFVSHQPVQGQPAPRRAEPGAVVLERPGMSAVRTMRDIAYSRADAGLTLDVSLPEQMSASRPAVFFIHGGPVAEGARPKDWALFRSYGALAATAGFVSVTLNHRFHTAGALATAEADVRDAIAFVRTNAKRFEIDPDRIAIWAFSGGGPIVSFALREPASSIKALVFYYAVLDVHGPMDGQRSGDPEWLSRFSPLASLEARGNDPAAPPLLIARAGRDDAALNRAIDRFVGAALRANRSITLLNHPLGRHGFDFLDAIPPSRDIIAQTIAFLQTATCATSTVSGSCRS